VPVVKPARSNDTLDLEPVELLKQAIPGISRVAVLWQPGTLGERRVKDVLKGAGVAARALGVRLHFVEARGPADIERAFLDMTRARGCSDCVGK
jgi:hypothetical protein